MTSACLLALWTMDRVNASVTLLNFGRGFPDNSVEAPSGPASNRPQAGRYPIGPAPSHLLRTALRPVTSRIAPDVRCQIRERMLRA